MQQFGVGKSWMLYHNNNIMIDTYTAAYKNWNRHNAQPLNFRFSKMWNHHKKR